MKKKTFVLRVGEETMNALERWAADDFRSINGQLEWIISKSLKEAGRLPVAAMDENTENSGQE